MGNRLSKIYTRTGDKGTTGLGDGSRIDKDDLRVESMGDIDELNSLIGMLVCELPADDSLVEEFREIQQTLFNLGGELSVPGYALIEDQHIEELETLLDRLNEELPPLKDFILPGGNRAASVCHLARSVCRRAERRLVSLGKQNSIRPQCQAYLNRLSDLLFVSARTLARYDGGSEVLWRHRQQKQQAK
ncbi:MAG: cob(I)yrinic acid a,c-diamide adenosyltransferase [Motiliproteus sp.]|nr:cob(I)yrinic acid a,c-diamide adenosyltransferase [Motiliproteus sp.]MCW9051025.1 cob(I)yrinic acid a,c-diamide adenosyltransferase [Motiliproteus sp.]